MPGREQPGEAEGVARLEGAPYPASCLVPLIAGVHDRAWVEVMRGCTRGCRFCQAGMWYRPVRERPPAEVLEMAGAELAATGHQELAFASLSTTDYSVPAGSADRRGRGASRGAASRCRRCGWTARRCGSPGWRRPPGPR